MTTWWDLTREFEQSFAEGISAFTKDLWKEDAITIDLVKRIRGILHGQTIHGESSASRIISRVFKADGSLEEMYGDLAIVLRIRYRDGQTLDGVAFYEAKRRDWDKNTFPAGKKSQLRNMHRALWNARLLVFDRERTVARLSEITDAPWWWDRDHPPPSLVAPVTQAFSIPLGPVLEAKRLDTSLYKFGTAFGCQLALRNLQGLDRTITRRHLLQLVGTRNTCRCCRELYSS